MAETYTPVPGYSAAGYTDDQAIYITSDKKIGSMDNQISIQGEANSQYIVYEIDRYHDGVDLSSKLIQIHYERSDGAGDNSAPVNVCMSDSRIRFGWIVPQNAVVLDGILKVMPFATGISPLGDVYILKTVYAEYRVQKGLAVGGGIEEPEAEWYLAFIERMTRYVDDAKSYAALCAEYEKNAKAYRDQIAQSIGSAETMATDTERYAGAVKESAQAVLDRESEAASFAGQSQSYAVGTNGRVRENDDLDCAKHFYEQIKRILENLEDEKLTFDLSDQAPVFLEAAKRENISSGEKLPVILGKIMKFFSDLVDVAFSGSYEDLKNLPELFSGEYSDLSGKPELADVATSGRYSDLDGVPDIPAIPASLPANGGNADEIGGKDLAYIMDYNNLTNTPAPPTAASLEIISMQATATLTTNWAGAEAPYSQTVTVRGVAANSIVDIDVVGSVTAEQLDAFINAKIVDGGQAANSITLKAFGDRPEIEIPIKIVVRKV
ncbi:MAG: hypothetical protein NC548_26930 [Lachnospiraceae bacterium]|nr:hypothetical protein [Lachnospiraceae bacterium]